MAHKDPKYGLEFSAGTVSLVRILAPGSFEVVDKADIEDADFAQKMTALHAVVTKDADRVITLPVFLRKLDTPVLTVRVEEEDDADAVINAQVAQAAGAPIEDLSVVEGDAHGPDQKVIYAKRALMREAKAFLAGYNFEPLYFAPRIRLADFPQDVRFTLGGPAKRARSPFIWGGLAAALVLGLGLSVSLDTDQNDTGPAVETIAQDLLPADLTVFETQDALPWDGKDITLNFADQTQTESVPVSLAAVTVPSISPKQDLFQLTGILGAPKRQAFNPQPIIEDTAEENATDDATSDENEQVVLADNLEETEDPDDLMVQAVTRAETAPELQQTLLDDVNTDQEATDPVVVARGDSLGNRPMLRPATLVAFAPASKPEGAQTGDAIAEDLLEQAIESDAERNENLENASRYAAVVTSRPPRKTNRWATNTALVLEAKRVAAASIKAEPAAKTETAAKPAAEAVQPKEKEARRVSNTFRRNQLSLIGVVGAPSSRRAIFRTPSGSIRTLKHGQRISGWQLVAIGESSVKVTRQGKEKTMRLP
ncbi:MAG: hypothetical protein AAF429_09050 [Pseudomonadota bacterium]